MINRKAALFRLYPTPAANADTNAAINILRRADSALKPAEEHRAKRPDEAGTSRRKAA